MTTSFLRVDGFEVPVLNASPIRSLSSRSDGRRRSMRGEIHDARRGVRRAWRLTCVALDTVHGFRDAEALCDLFSGAGHLLSFGTGLAASTGLNPRPGWTGLAWNDGVGFGGEAGYLDVTAALAIDYDAQLPIDDWSVLLRAGRGGVSPFFDEATLYRSDGRVWQAGAESSGTPSVVFPAVVDGVVRLAASAPTELDDVVILPWRVSDEMAEQMTDERGTFGPQFGPLPVHRASGAMFEDAHVLVVGDVVGTTYVQKPQSVSGNVAGTVWVENAQLVDVELGELPPSFARVGL